MSSKSRTLKTRTFLKLRTFKISYFENSYFSKSRTFRITYFSKNLVLFSEITTFQITTLKNVIKSRTFQKISYFFQKLQLFKLQLFKKRNLKNRILAL